MFKKFTVILLLLAALAVLPACLDDAVKPIKEAPPVTWPELTREDDPVQAIVMCYENPSLADVMTRYESLLHSEYFFMLAPEDVDVGEDAVITRAEDLTSTAWIFSNQIVLELAVSAGSWEDYPEIEGKACEGCRVTTRSYFIRAQFDRDGNVYQCSPDGTYVTIVVAPDESDASKWVIRAIYDHGT